MQHAKLEVTRSGLYALWEKGGATTNDGDVTLIAGMDGEPLPPLVIRRRGDLACKEHALLPIRYGHLILMVSKRRDNIVAAIWKVIGFDTFLHHAKCDEIAVFATGQWSPVLDPALKDFVEAGFKKVTTFHCREPMWIKQETKAGEVHE